MADTKRKTLYEDSLFRLVWDEETKVLESTSVRQMSSAELRTTQERMLAFIREKKVRKYLADMTLLGNVSAEDILWSETDWFPRCLKAGLKSIAMVMPKALAMHVTIDKKASQSDNKTEYERRFFKDVESAREWIVKQ